MRLLADENVPGPVVAALQERGHDVVSVRELMRGASDREVLQRAQKEARVLITFDRDFGELAYRSHLPATSGVILFRLTGQSPKVDNMRVVSALDTRSDWAGHFAVITDDRIRIRPLPN